MVDFIIAVAVEMKRTEWNQDIFIVEWIRFGGKLDIGDKKEEEIKTHS